MLQFILTLAISQLAAMLTFRLFPVLTSSVNMPAMHSARVLRHAFRMKRSWSPGVYAGAAMIWSGRAATSLLVPVAVFMYFEVPDREAVKVWVALAATTALLLVWMPGMFLLALASAEDEPSPPTAP